MMEIESTISELLSKCEKQNVDLPENPWQALRVTISALRNNKHQKKLQIEKAFEQLLSEFGKDLLLTEIAGTTAESSRGVDHPEATALQEMPKRSRRNLSIMKKGSDRQAKVISSKATREKKTKAPKKNRIQEQVEAMPAVRDENQLLVNQLVQLGDYEMKNGYTQRGLARLRAAKEIRNSQLVITSGAQAKKLDHVGPVMATKVDQLLNEGLEAALSEYNTDTKVLPGSK
ncbi:hypothetical protein CCR75_007217 [Bremia lactucae]|uniref:Crossover junction endonuclease MUS81-like HHH domain-containing protein n=1 Tax=Bremia lactucae TaxID=4779 RepID=A0A976FER1_BRELC|nr:hypothetical protein CCR75_007217 [Bremia lactucae]